MMLTENIPLNEDQGIFLIPGGSMPVVAAYKHSEKCIYLLLRAQAYWIAFPSSFNDYKIIKLSHNKEFSLAHL